MIENSTIANNGSGIATANAHGVRITNNEIVNNGWTGVHATDSNRLFVQGNNISYNNFRHWTNSVEAGMKHSQSKDGAVVDNIFEHNAASGFWCDQGCGSTNLTTNWYVIARNLIHDNDGKGIFYEVSHHAVIASNVIHDNGASGIASYGTRAVQIWNNTLVNNNAAGTSYASNISLLDDNRCAQGDILPGGKPCSSATSGVVPLARTQYDNCAPSTDGALANSCNNESVVVVNNIVSGSGSSRPLVNVTIPAKTYSAAQAVSRNDYQSYYRPSASAPTGLIEWQKDAAGAPISYGSLSTYRAAIAGREANSIERMGGTTNPFFVDAAGKNFTQNTGNSDVWGRGAALPSEVLKALYWPSSGAQPSARIGAITWAKKSTAPPPPPPPAAGVCVDAAPVFHVHNPTTDDHIFTISSSEAKSAKDISGYTDDQGIAFRAYTSVTGGRDPVFRIYNPTTKNHLFTTSASEKASAATKYGYTTDEGTAFYAAVQTVCGAPVYRFSKGGHHTLSVSATERQALVAAGWADEGTRFFAGTP